MAVAAIDAVIAYVMLMTEGYWLLEWNIDIGRIGRPKNLRGRPARAANQNDHADNYDARINIGVWRKKLSHEDLKSTS